jgi:bacterioferritin-associated ferredoxin
MDLDDEICYCFHVTKRKILQYLRVCKPRRVSQVSECGGAGTGCGWCRPFLKRYFKQVVERSAASQAEPQAHEYGRLRTQYIRAGHGTPPPGATPMAQETSDGDE